MKRWITVTVVNTAKKLTEIDADSIIGIGPKPGNTAHTLVYLTGGHMLEVTDGAAIIKHKIAIQ